MENTELGPRPATAPVSRLSRAQEHVLSAVCEQGPATITELSATTGLHANTLRGHLDALANAGLLAREREQPSGRGRPAWRWSATPPANHEYAGLAAALARTLKATSNRPAADAVEAGRSWGHDLAATRSPRSDDAAREAVALLDDLGFAPHTPKRPSGQVRLTRCPLLEAAREEPTIVCNVHLGLVVGALEEYAAPDPDAHLTPFAEHGACLLRIASS